MVCVKPKRFPQGIAKKLLARSNDQIKVLKRLDPNACVLDLPPDMGTSSTFNVEDLVPFLGHIASTTNSYPTIAPTDLTAGPRHGFERSYSSSQYRQPSPPPPKAQRKEIAEDILDDIFLSR